MVVTREWIKQHASHPTGEAWTREQLKILGVSWPPKKGWLSWCVGLKISADERAKFESLGAAARALKPRPGLFETAGSND